MNRLIPVYEAIDDEKYELAIKICDKAMKKAGHDYQTLKALKALAKGRSGFYQEAYDLAYEVKQSKPVDAPTLQAVFMTLKLVHMHNDIAELYETAFKMSPGNEEWANHWFMALARIGDWKLLQQAAIKINKAFKKPKYYFWMTMAIYLQAIDPNVQNQSLLLSLAERMMNKAFEEGKIQDFETLQFYVHILCSCEKFDAAYSILSGELGTLCKVETERKKMCVEILSKIGDDRNDDIAQLCHELLNENPDDWLTYTAYIQSMFKLGKSAELILFLKSLQESLIKSDSQRVTRGAFLAELYVFQHSQNYENMVNLIIRYVNLFGSTLCCFDDLYPILEHVPENQINDLIENISDILDINLKVEGKQIDQTRLNITSLKLMRFFKSKLNQVDVSTEVSSLLEFYRKSLHLKVKDEREQQYGDDYILLAAHAILDEYFLNRNVQSYLVDAISLLEYGLEKSKFNYQFKILLIRLYVELGISARSFDLATSLEIKNIQFDTLSYLFTDGVEMLGCVDSAFRYLRTSLSIYDRNEIETPEMIIQAFKFGTYSKIPEFIDFKRQLQLSVQKAVTNRQINRLELLKAGSWTELCSAVRNLDLDTLALDGACPFLNFSTLSDNRDTSIIPRYTQKSSFILSDLRESRFPVDAGTSSKYWLNLHSFIPLLYSSALGNGEFKGFSITPNDVNTFLENVNLNRYESLAIRILVLILQKNEDANFSAAFEDRLREIQDLWNSIEEKFENMVVLFSLITQMSFCIEAWNAALTVTYLQKNKAWKSIISKQIRSAKKELFKFRTLLANEPNEKLQSRLTFVNISLDGGKAYLEFIQRGWDTSISGILDLLERKIGILASDF